MKEKKKDQILSEINIILSCKDKAQPFYCTEISFQNVDCLWKSKPERLWQLIT